MTLEEQNQRLMEALRKLSFAADARENTLGDVCTLLASKAALAEASREAHLLLQELSHINRLR